MVDFNLFSQLNSLAVLTAAVAAFIIGALWYSPLLFGNVWAEAKGLKLKKMKKGAGRPGMLTAMLANFLGNLIQSYVLAFFLSFWGAVSSASGQNVWFENLIFVFWIWFGFVVISALNEVLWGGQKLSVFAIQLANNAVILFATVTILTFWK